MFQFTAYSFEWLSIHHSIMHRCIGFPHSDISGSLRTYRSPKLFVVRHVLHRLLVPRHSPCALFYLTLLKNSLLGRSTICSLWLSRFFAWIIFSFQCTNSWLLSKSMEANGFEPMTSCVQSRCSPIWAKPPITIRQTQFYRLSLIMSMGLNGLEPSTSRLSGVRSKPAEL